MPFTQEQIALRGAAIECRIYAEDPANNFFPSPGRIEQLAEPGGPGVRVDSGIYQGWNVPIEYDPMLSKLIVWSDTREHAIERMLRALNEYHVGGIKSNIGLFRAILNDPAFRAGDLHTGYLDAASENGSRVESAAFTGTRASGRARCGETGQDGSRATGSVVLTMAGRRA